MITLTRISGSVFVLNADLIERIDSTPDTVISLVDGKKYVVLESPTVVTRAVRDFRSEILSHSYLPVSESAQSTEPFEPRHASVAHLATVAPIREES